MRIAIDLQSLQGPYAHTGLGRGVLGLARALIRHGEGHDVALVFNALAPHDAGWIEHALLLPPGAVTLWTPASRMVHFLPFHEERASAIRDSYERCILNLDVDILLLTSLFDYYEGFAYSLHFHDPSVITAGLVHDFFEFHEGKQKYLDSITKEYSASTKRRLIADWRKKLETQLDAIDILFANSDYVLRQCREKFPHARSANIGTDADAIFTRLETAACDARMVRSRFGLDGDFVLYSGRADARKNIISLLQAYAALGKELTATHRLVIVADQSDEFTACVAELCAHYAVTPGRYVFTGRLCDSDLVLLYNTCKLFVFPSLAEGFGLTPLEAMRCGAAVIGSRATALPEIIGMEEALFDPLDIQAMSAKIRMGLTDAAFHARLVAHGRLQQAKFSWRDTARRCLETFSAHIAEQPLAGR